MKRYSLLLACLFCLFFSHGQVIKKVPISNTGCFVYTYCDLKFEMDYSGDSSKVYVSECPKDGVNYGVICVKLLKPENDLAVAEEALISYMDYLKTSFKITKSAGYGKGHRLNNDENTRGVIDYWEDNDKNNWKIKGWTDGKFIGILYAYSPKELNETRVNIFLESFRLPGM